MINEDWIQLGYPPEVYLNPWLYPDIFPDYEFPSGSAPGPVPKPTPEPEPVVLATPPPEASAPPVEVVTVDNLLEAAEAGIMPADLIEDVEEGVEVVEEGLELAVLQEISAQLVEIRTAMSGKLGEQVDKLEGIGQTTTAIHQITDHPALTTSFADYTVTEALLLLLLLSAFLAACARMLKGGLSWLRS